MLQNAVPSAVWRAALFTEAPVPMALCDSGGRFVDCNERFSNLVGYARQELHAKSGAAITHPDDYAGDEAARAQLLDAGTFEDTYQICKRFIHKSGDFVWANTHVARVRDQQGQVMCFIYHAVPLVSGNAQVAVKNPTSGQSIEIRPTAGWFDLVRQNPKETLIAVMGLTLLIGTDAVREIIAALMRR